MLIPHVFDTASDPAAGAEAVTVKSGAATNQADWTVLLKCGFDLFFQALIAMGAAALHVPSV
jgi:hypothetical protein